MSGGFVSALCISMADVFCVNFCLLGSGWLAFPLVVLVGSVVATLGVQCRDFACSSGVSIVVSLLGLVSSLCISTSMVLLSLGMFIGFPMSVSDRVETSIILKVSSFGGPLLGFVVWVVSAFDFLFVVCPSVDNLSFLYCFSASPIMSPMFVFLGSVHACACLRFPGVSWGFVLRGGV